MIKKKSLKILGRMVPVAQKPNQSLQSPEHVYRQREKSQGAREIKEQRKEKYWDGFCRMW